MLLHSPTSLVSNNYTKQKKTIALNVLCSTREILKETLAAEGEYYRDKWTRFGNEAEKVELDVIRNQRVLRTRVDKMALRKQVKAKFWSQGLPCIQLRQHNNSYSLNLVHHVLFSTMQHQSWPVSQQQRKLLI